MKINLFISYYTSISYCPSLLDPRILVDIVSCVAMVGGCEL